MSKVFVVRFMENGLRKSKGFRTNWGAKLYSSILTKKGIKNDIKAVDPYAHFKQPTYKICPECKAIVERLDDPFAAAVFCRNCGTEIKWED